MPWKPWKKEQVPVFIGTQEPITNTEDTIIVDTGSSRQEEEEVAPTGTTDAKSSAASGPLRTEEVNPTGDHMPKGPRSEAPENDDLATSKPKRQYRTTVTTDFNQGATGTRSSRRLHLQKGEASLTSEAARDQNSDQALYAADSLTYDLNVRDAIEYAFPAIEGSVPVPKNTKEAL